VELQELRNQPETKLAIPFQKGLCTILACFISTEKRTTGNARTSASTSTHTRKEKIGVGKRMPLS